MKKSEMPVYAHAAAVLKKGIGHILCAAVGFLLSGVDFAGELVPFGLSFVGGADTAHTLSAALGASAGYLFFCDISGALRMISASVLVCFIKLGTAKLFRPGRVIYMCTVTVFAASFVCSAIVSSADGTDAAAVLTCMCEAMIAAAGACLLYRIFYMASSGGVKCTSSADICALLFSVGVILLGFMRMGTVGTVAAHCVAGFAVMLFSLCDTGSPAFMSGICFGVMLGLAQTQRHLLPAFALAGLLCGICGDYGKPATASAYAASDILALLLCGELDSMVPSLVSVVCAVCLFVFIPKKALYMLVSSLLPQRGDSSEEEQRRLMRFRLKSAAKAVREVGASVKAVTDILVKADIPDDGYIPGSVRSEVCGKCVKREFCWEHSGAHTAKAFEELHEVLKKDGAVCVDAVPRRLSIVCCDQRSVCEAFNRLFCEYNARLTARRELFETKELAAMQFSGASAVLEDAAEGLAAVEKCDPRTAAAAKEVLDDFGYEADPVIAYSDSRGRSTVEAFCSRMPRTTDFVELSETLFEKTGFSYLDPITDEYSDLGTVLSFCEAAEFSAEVHVASRTGAGEIFCGDTCESFSDGRGNFYVVLSDGMGRGKRAALDSAMACSLMSRLMRAGFSLECAVNGVNSALMMKSAEETLSTLDILKLDLTDGKAEFYKAGAAMSAVRTGEKTAIVEKASLPLGILREVDMESSEIKLRSGDRIVIMSDGASVLSPAYFKELFARMKKKSIKELAETAADDALRYSPSGRHDDITVACVEIL